MKTKSCTFWTIGAITAGTLALGMAGMAMTKHKSHRRHGMNICGCHIDPVKDMRRMADNVHDMVSDVISHQCGHLH